MSPKYRYLNNKIKRIIADFSILLVAGPRRSGKSTLAKKIINDWGGGAYYSFDTPQEQLLVKNDPQLFIQNLTYPVVLDEIQNVPEIFPYLKSAVDGRNKNGGIDIILTGSQNFELMSNIRESLAGRILIYELLPFSLLEALEVPVDQSKNIFDSIVSNKPIEKLDKTIPLEIAVLNGGYPPLWEIKEDSYKTDWFNSYCLTYVERDVRSILNIKDLSMFQKFISLVAHRAGKLINYSELGKDISVSYKTSKEYLSVLEASYLWRNLPAYSKNIEERITKSGKGIFVDSGLCCHLHGINSSQSFSLSPNKDSIFESFVIMEIIKLSKYFAPELNFYHYHRSNNIEVDLVIDKAGYLIPIEIKNSAKFNSNWINGIKDFKDKVGKLYAGFGYVFSRYEKVFEISPGIYNVPIQYVVGAK